MYSNNLELETYIKYLMGHSNKGNITFNLYNDNNINVQKIRQMIKKIEYNFEHIEQIAS